MSIDPRTALPTVLDDLAVGPYPEYVDDVLAITAVRRQRPRWTFPERWLPMDLTTQAAPSARLPWRTIGVLALLAIALAAAAAVYIGSQQRRAPAPPFGPAANGAIVLARDGDIVTVDPASGTTTTIVTGPERDVDPLYSPDGTHIAFARTDPTKPNVSRLFLVDDRGGGLVQVTPEGLRGLDSWAFAPDGRSIAALAAGPTSQEITILPTDGSGQVQRFPVFATVDDTPLQYGADGAEILFIGREPGQDRRGVYALDPVSGAVRTIVAPRPTPLDIHGATWAPDGSHVAYGAYDPNAGGLSARTHIVKADGTGDTTLETDPRSQGDSGFDWSNDSTRLVVWQAFNDTRGATAILSIDGSTPAVEVPCPPPGTADNCEAEWSWSPDDSTLLGSLSMAGETTYWLVDTTTGELRAAPWTAEGRPVLSRPVWQRLAP